MRGFKTVFGLVAILGMMVYAVPRIEVASGGAAATAFALCWSVFALLILASHLHQWLGVDEETTKEMERIRRMKRWKMQQWIAEKSGMQDGSARGLR